MSSSASVTPRMADATTTARDGRVATIWAACLMDLASARAAPPNLCTTMTADAAERPIEREREREKNRTREAEAKAKVPKPDGEGEAYFTAESELNNGG